MVLLFISHLLRGDFTPSARQRHLPTAPPAPTGSSFSMEVSWSFWKTKIQTHCARQGLPSKKKNNDIYFEFTISYPVKFSFSDMFGASISICQASPAGHAPVAWGSLWWPREAWWSWWLSLPPLKNMSSSIGRMKFQIYRKITLMFQTTNHFLVFAYY